MGTTETVQLTLELAAKMGTPKGLTAFALTLVPLVWN